MASSGESLPIGAAGQALGSSAPPQEAPAERRERGMRALSVGARLLAGGTIFFFLAFAFAYFYLRTLNVAHMWRPKHVKPDQALGAAWVACVVISGVLAALASARERRESSNWLTPGFLAVLFGLAAVALQCVEFTTQKFGPTDGAFASVFCAWLIFYLMFTLGAMYWLEISVATEYRERRAPTARPGEGVDTYEDPDKLLPRGLDAAAFYWVFLAAIGVVTYVILYLL
jgi:heme/copper-type cytochrome/quinol oxidase subunit 3